MNKKEIYLRKLIKEEVTKIVKTNTLTDYDLENWKEMLSDNWGILRQDKESINVEHIIEKLLNELRDYLKHRLM